ncbi:MAG: putative peptidoglycan glycosyltransferase FtsW [Verrucomicrobiota bacterium]
MPRSRRKSNTAVGGVGIINPAALLLVFALFLSILGLTVLFSASLPVNDESPYLLIGKQMFFMLATFVLGLIILKIDLEWSRKLIWLGYGLCIVALVAVLIPGIGREVNGSRSWIRFGAFGFQAAEFAKIGTVFFLAHYFSLIRKETDTFWKGFVFPCFAIGLVVGLIMLQTDLGTALIISMVCFCLLFLAGSPLRYLIPSAVGGFGAAVFLVSHDTERWSRLTAFLDREGQKAGDAYQAHQAILSFGAGGTEGVGLGNGRQQHQFLPEAHNDFIFAIVGEELGLVATLLVVTAFLGIFLAGMWHMRKAPNMYQYLIGWGCLLTITIQAIVNLGVVTGTLPTTGLPLPFISSGGSNFIVMGMCVAVLLNTSFAWKTPALNQSKRKLKEI